jgi:8-oxo-dGTP diphosphatase
MADPPRVVDVAAAVIMRPDGRFLLARRPPGKVYADYWEFPGGKAEAAEPLAAALVRELHEELGIEVTRAYPWIVEEYVYPHAHVRLHFFRVLEWRGEPHPRERQELSWAALGDIGVAPLLPANGPVLRALALPSILAITNAAELGIAAALERVERALARGVRLVMVREKQMTPAQLLAFGAEVVARCRRPGSQVPGAQVVVNSDAQVAQAISADGLHLPSVLLMAATARPPFALCGASCHDERELHRAAELDLDYVMLGPVLPTASHPQAAGLGWEALSRLIRSYRLPVYALGGMREEHLEQAWKAGAHGIALMRALG